jgi:hypothetical protein
MEARGTAVLVLSVGLVAGSASTGEHRLAYHAPPGCPDDEAFEAEIAARTASAVRTGRAARTFDVTVEATSGVLTIREPDGTSAVRRVQAASCVEVVSALALVAALALDPNAGGAKGAQAAPPPKSVEPAAPPPPVEAPIPSPEPTSPASAAAWHSGAGAEAVARAGASPGWLFGAAMYVETGPPDYTGRITITDLPSAAMSTDAGTVRFSLFSARAEICRGTLLSLCLGLEVGRHAAEGEVGGPIRAPDRAAVVWFAPVGAADLAIPVGPVVLGAGADLVLPLVREKFVVGAAETLVYQAPAIALGGRIGVGVRFGQ